MITMKQSRIGHMSCNPAIGGVAKGTVVKEIDALGGVMGEAADRAAIQFRMLNRRKGPAVWGPRVQCDLTAYARSIRRALDENGVVIVENEAIGFDWSGERVTSVILADGGRIGCRSVVLAPGTFLGAVLFRGRERWSGGRLGDIASNSLCGHLAARGFHVERFKTGTPPRILAGSIDYTMVSAQAEEGGAWRFSSRRGVETSRVRAVCHTARTVSGTVAAARAGLAESPLYSGVIRGRGPRYCPSFEDKVVRFPDREHHPVFFEPTGLGSRLVYLNGVSTSLPRDNQLEMIRSLPGCGRAVVAIWGYAVEYGYLPGTQIGRDLMLESTGNVFVAGQICGTSGYEEAAGFGLVAGVNAAAVALGRSGRFVPDPGQSYIGVMISDISGKDLAEPYRLFSSRAENRMHLRPDNAWRRMLRTSIETGISRPGDERLLDSLERDSLGIANVLRTERHGGKLLSELCRQPEFDPGTLGILSPGLSGFDPELVLSVALDERYAGYVEKAARKAKDVQRMATLDLRGVADFRLLDGISWEARESLERRRPANLREAAELPGMRPSDLEGLLIGILRRVPRGTAV
jgi:tRNA uridine 5-carboxymethylaminomethyl modification enzyme